MGTFRLWSTALLAAASGAAVVASSPTDSRGDKTMYQVEARLVQCRPDGTQQVLAEPVLATVAERPMSFSNTYQVPAPNNLPGNKRVTAGKTLELTLHRTDEGLFLDGEFKVATVKEAGQHSVRVATVGMRLMEKITLGKPIVVPFVLSETPEQHGRFELVVTEAVPGRLVRQLHPVR